MYVFIYITKLCYIYYKLYVKKIVIRRVNKLYLLPFKRSITYFKRKVTVSNYFFSLDILVGHVKLFFLFNFENLSKIIHLRKINSFSGNAHIFTKIQ